MMKGKRCPFQLYILQDSRVIGDAAVSISSLLDEEVTKL